MIHMILHTDLQRTKRCAKLILRILSHEEKQNHILRRHDLDNPTIADCVIVSDELWLYEYDFSTRGTTVNWMQKVNHGQKHHCQNQMHVDCPFWCSWHSSPWACSRWDNSNSHIPHWGAKMFTQTYPVILTRFVEKQIWGYRNNTTAHSSIGLLKIDNFYYW